ncbi:hypothetical protein HMPREF1572_01415, partial [Gardnerella vaginalis JCP7275]
VVRQETPSPHATASREILSSFRLNLYQIQPIFATKCASIAICEI